MRGRRIEDVAARVQAEASEHRGDGAEAQIDAFISRRHDQRSKSEGEWAVVAFFAEACFRVELAFDVLAGHVPKVRPRQWWNRAIEPPVLIDAFDWTDERLLFSILVWPPLEDRGGHRERARQVLDVLQAGAADMNWSTLYEVDEGVTWDASREVWTGSDGFAHDGERLRRHSRAGS